MSFIRKYIRQLDNRDRLLFVVGLLVFIKLKILGTFATAEILIFAVTPFIPFRQFMRDPRMRTFFTLACVWLLGVLIADFYNESTLENCLKGAFNVVFLILLIPFSYWTLHDKPERMLTFLAGAAISSYVAFLLFGSGYESEVSNIVWGYYAIQYLFVAAAAFLYFSGHRKAGCVTLFMYGFYGLFNLSRYTFLLYTLDVIILFSIGKVTERNRRARRRALYRHALFLVLCLCAAFGGIRAVYSGLAAGGMLGKYAQEKYRSQAETVLGIASGRVDFFEAGYAIIANPLMGYGSFAIDKDNVVNRFREKVGLERATNRGVTGINKSLPTHSYLFGAWVQSGILGMLIWLWAFIILVKFLTRYLLYRPRLVLLNLALASMTLWDILFSPLSSRPIVVFSMTFFIIQYSQAYLYDKKRRLGNKYLDSNTVVQPG